MTLVITKNIVKDRPNYLPLAKAFVTDARQDKGCLDMQIALSKEEEDSVTFLSHWNSPEDFTAHCSGETFAKHIPVMSSYYISGTDTILEVVE